MAINDVDVDKILISKDLVYGKNEGKWRKKGVQVFYRLQKL